MILWIYAVIKGLICCFLLGKEGIPINFPQAVDVVLVVVAFSVAVVDPEFAVLVEQDFNPIGGAVNDIHLVQFGGGEDYRGGFVR